MANETVVALIAQDADIFLQQNEVVEFFKAVVISYNKHGLRQDRDCNRH